MNVSLHYIYLLFIVHCYETDYDLFGCCFLVYIYLSFLLTTTEKVGFITMDNKKQVYVKHRYVHIITVICLYCTSLYTVFYNVKLKILYMHNCV